MSAVKTEHLLPAIMLMVGEMAAGAARERLRNSMNQYKELLQDKTPMGQIKQTAMIGQIVAAGDEYVSQMQEAIDEYRKAAREVSARTER